MKTHEDVLEAAYKVDQRLGDALHRKYEERRNQILDFVERKSPSKSPEYWAKITCNKCVGRGLVTINDQPHICKCSLKNYQKWTLAILKEVTDPSVL